jgi:hypothetical protein
MKLAKESHRRLEEFFREHLQDRGLHLPPIYIHSGRIARLITGKLRVGAITFGRHILLSPERVIRAGDMTTAPGWLVAHEATHVLQYERDGLLRFFFKYLMGYWRALREIGKFDYEARMKAYLTIAEEQSAHEVERAYQQWSARQPDFGGKVK